MGEQIRKIKVGKNVIFLIGEEGRGGQLGIAIKDLELDRQH